VKLVHLVGFITKKSVAMQRGHTNVKPTILPPYFPTQNAQEKYMLPIIIGFFFTKFKVAKELLFIEHFYKKVNNMTSPSLHTETAYNSSKFLRRRVSALPWKGLKTSIISNVSAGKVTQRREQHVACELRVALACTKVID
jgi:hypothetical protein